MQKHELLHTIDGAWNELSQKRGYHVQKDSPVCIFITPLVQRKLPFLTLMRMPVPEEDDFEAVLVGEVNGRMSLIDPAHLCWLRVKPTIEPSVEKATLVFPIMPDFDTHDLLPIGAFNPAYVTAMTQFVRQLAASRDS